MRVTSPALISGAALIIRKLLCSPKPVLLLFSIQLDLANFVGGETYYCVTENLLSNLVFAYQFFKIKHSNSMQCQTN